MEISLLTGVHLILTIFDKEEGKIIQYLSDSMSKFQAINQLKEVEVKKKFSKGDEGEDVLPENEGQTYTKFVAQNLISEIYTNDHVSETLPNISSTSICSKTDLSQRISKMTKTQGLVMKWMPFP
jgi:hypothetical protein